MPIGLTQEYTTSLLSGEERCPVFRPDSERFTATVKASLLLRFSLLALFVGAILGWKVMTPADSDLPWGVVLIVIANTAISVDLQAVYDSWNKMTRHALYRLLQRGLYFAVIWSILLVNQAILSVFSVGAATLLSVLVYLALQYLWAAKRLPAESAPGKYVSLSMSLTRGNVLIWIAALGGCRLVR